MKYAIAFLFLTFLFGCKHRPSRLRYAIYGVADSISRGFDSVQIFYGDWDSDNDNGSVRFNYCYGNNYLKMDSAEEAKYQFMYIKIDSIARIQMKTGHYWVMHDSWFGEDSSNIHLNDYHIVISKSKSLDTVKNFSTPSAKHKATANKKVDSTFDGLICGSYSLLVDAISGNESYYRGEKAFIPNTPSAIAKSRIYNELHNLSKCPGCYYMGPGDMSKGELSLIGDDEGPYSGTPAYILFNGEGNLIDSTPQRCKFRLINQTESTIRVKIHDMSLDTMVAPGDTTRYWLVDSIRQRPLYELDVDGGKFAGNPAKVPAWIHSGIWELVFRWSDRRQVFFSVMNQSPE